MDDVIIGIIGGPNNWPDIISGYNVVHFTLNRTRWYSERDNLFIVYKGKIHQIEGIIWRLGAVRPYHTHRAILELIKKTNTPCVNSVETLLAGYDRLSMLNELQKIELPIINYDVYIGDNLLWNVKREYPFVVKFGNYHGGYAKALIRDENQWRDIIDLSYAIDDYVTIEDYIDYKRDIRCLLVGNKSYAMVREGLNWKVNHLTTNIGLISPPDELLHISKKAQKHFKADILGLDFLETSNGEYILLESNDIPGLKGFPLEIKKELLNILLDKLRK